MKSKELEQLLNQDEKFKADSYYRIKDDLDIEKNQKKDAKLKDDNIKINIALESENKEYITIDGYVNDLTNSGRCVSYSKIKVFRKGVSRQIKEFFPILKNMNDGQKIQMIFWLMYSLFYVTPKDWAEAFKNVCRAIAYLEINEDELTDIIAAVRYVHNVDLSNPNYISLYGKTYFERFSSKLASNNQKSSNPQQYTNAPDTSNIDKNYTTKSSELITQHIQYVRAYEKYIKANFPMVFIDTIEETEAISVINEAAQAVLNNVSIYEWDLVIGLKNTTTNQIAMEHSSFFELLSKIESDVLDDDTGNYIYIIRNIEEYYDNTQVAGRLKILSEKISNAHNINIHMFLIGRDIRIGTILEKNVYYDDQIGYPDETTIKEIIQDFKNEKHLSKNIHNDQLISKCKGLTREELRRVLNLAYADEDNFEISAIINVIQNEKEQIIKKTGLIELVRTEGDVNNLAGLENLKDWLDIKAKIINNTEEAHRQQVDIPKGVLLIGMPGCGKSLSAKTAAGKFNVPLLRIDVGSLMDKYVGESEHNFKKALKIAEAISPCVLWVDEIEKAFGVSKDNDQNASELSGRILGNLLTWMQEKRTLTFVIATANNVKKLPPELIRKGRFDEVFFVGLPNSTERKDIIALHLAKRGITYENLNPIVSKTNGFSGAELEYVVRDVTEQRFISYLDNSKITINEKMFFDAIDNTEPLSTTMKKELDEMEEFCKQRKFKAANRK